MKKLIIFSFVIIESLATLFYFVREDQFGKQISAKNILTLSSFEKKTILASIDSSNNQWGVLEDSSTFFVSSDLLKAYQLDTVKIFIYEVGTESSPFTERSKQSYFFTFSEETINMEKVGNYYVAKSTKKYIDPVFYCQAGNDGISAFPDDRNDLKIYGRHVLRNQEYGLLLRVN